MRRLLPVLVASALVVACSDSADPDAIDTAAPAVASTSTTATPTTPATTTTRTATPTTTATTTTGDVSPSTVATPATEPASPATVVELPEQPSGVPFPAETWPAGDLPDGVDRDALDALADIAFGNEGDAARARSVVVVHGGRLVYEAYRAPFDATTVHSSYSVAKSVTSAAIGMLVGDGLVSLDDPAPVAGWDDERRQITVGHLLHMASGLEWLEVYGAGSAPFEMFAAPDASESAAAHPLVAEPGTTFNYSTGTTAILAQILTDAAWAQEQGAAPDPDLEPDPDAGVRFLDERLFTPLGIRSVQLMRDPEGTWLGGIGANMTSRDFARFGLLYMRDGVWDGVRLLPEGWVQYSFTASPADEGYGAQWWLEPDTGRYEARGLLGQLIVLAPDDDLVVVVNSDDGGVAVDLADGVVGAFRDR